MATASSPWRTREVHDRDGGGHEASIWPRHHRRGEPGSAGWPTSARTRFNLATASSPWRTPRRRRSAIAPKRLQFGHGIIAVENISRFLRASDSDRGFNLATASSPWRTVGPGDKPGSVRAASIWPRHHRRGERRTPARRRGSGRRFNLATASSPWRTPVGIVDADSVPDASIWPRHHRRGERPLASRRERSTRARFNLATASSPWRTRSPSDVTSRIANASIWPRHHRRGERVVRHPDLAAVRGLQFGHGIIAVENPGSCRRRSST